MASIEERKAKIARIEELKVCGLNVPRMFFVENKEDASKYEAAEWVRDIHQKDPGQIFNIRTYARAGNLEKLGCPHVCDLDYKVVLDELHYLIHKYHCMVDAETPDAGRMAGNLLVEVNHIGRPATFQLEFVEKYRRAMVRDIETEKGTIVKGKIPVDHSLPYSAKTIITIGMALTFMRRAKRKENTIFEWTWFDRPSGVKGENLVFWEYRRAS